MLYEISVWRIEIKTRLLVIIALSNRDHVNRHNMADLAQTMLMELKNANTQLGR